MMVRCCRHTGRAKGFTELLGIFSCYTFISGTNGSIIPVILIYRTFVALRIIKFNLNTLVRQLLVIGNCAGVWRSAYKQGKCYEIIATIGMETCLACAFCVFFFML